MALEIALTILKIIGIVLCGILALLLIIILLALFVPFRYRIDSGYDKCGKITASGKVTYLLHAVTVYFSFCRTPGEKQGEGEDADRPAVNEMTGGVRIFGIRIINLFPSEEEKEKKRLKKEKKERRAALRKEKKKEKEPDDLSGPDTGFSADHTAGAKISDEEPYRTDAAEPGAGDQEKQEYGFIEKVRLFVLKLYDLWDFIREQYLKLQEISLDVPDKAAEKSREMRKNIERLSKKAKRYYLILQKEYTKSAFNKAKKAVIKILKAIAPRKGYLRAGIGMEDVAVTGQIAGIYGMLYGMFYPFIGKYVTADLDFDAKRLEAELMLSGRIMLCCFIRAAWLYFFDKDVRHLKAVLKKAGEI